MSERILVIEDQRDIREPLEMLLEISGHDVRAVTDGCQALKLLREGFEADVILLDLMMPEMDGWEFRRRQLSDPQLSDIPVVVISGAHFTQEQARSLQAHEVLRKPVEVQRVLDVLGRLLD